MSDTGKRLTKKSGVPAEKKRASLSFRLAPDIKGMLEDAARNAGRSVSQEAEYRLMKSFYTEGLLMDAMSLKWGPVLADQVIDYANLAASLEATERLIREGLVDEWYLRPHIEKGKAALLDFHRERVERFSK